MTTANTEEMQARIKAAIADAIAGLSEAARATLTKKQLEEVLEAAVVRDVYRIN